MFDSAVVSKQELAQYISSDILESLYDNSYVLDKYCCVYSCLAIDKTTIHILKHKKKHVKLTFEIKSTIRELIIRRTGITIYISFEITVSNGMKYINTLTSHCDVPLMRRDEIRQILETCYWKDFRSYAGRNKIYFEAMKYRDRKASIVAETLDRINDMFPITVTKMIKPA